MPPPKRWESAHHKQALAEGKEDSFENMWGLLFDVGEEARSNGIPFDEDRTEPWKKAESRWTSILE